MNQPAVNKMIGLSPRTRTIIILLSAENDSENRLELMFLTGYPPPPLGVQVVVVRKRSFVYVLAQK
jgi:hypothetical protein